MKYRDTEYAVMQESNRGTWRWTVDLDEKTAEAGQRKTHEAAVIAVELTIDRWLARQAERSPPCHPPACRTDEEIVPPLVANPAWTPADEQKLRTMLMSGEHPTAIGKQLNRSEVAIRRGMTKLGLRSQCVKGRPVSLAPSERMQALRASVSAGEIRLRAKGK
jgi:hypothetical protein